MIANPRPNLPQFTRSMLCKNALAIAAGLLVGLLARGVAECHAQGAASPADTTTKRGEAQKTEAVMQNSRRWGLGVRISQLFGLSARYAITERFTAQVAGFPIPLEGVGLDIGGRLLYKLYVQPTHNFYVAGGASLFRGEEFTNPFTEESQRDRGYTVFATLGGEYRFAERLGLSGGAGISYFVQRSAVLDRNEVFPMIELGLHYYFK